MDWIVAIGVGLAVGGLAFWLFKKHKADLCRREEDAERLRRWTEAETRATPPPSAVA